MASQRRTSERQGPAHRWSSLAPSGLDAQLRQGHPTSRPRAGGFPAQFKGVFQCRSAPGAGVLRGTTPRPQTRMQARALPPWFCDLRPRPLTSQASAALSLSGVSTPVVGGCWNWVGFMKRFETCSAVKGLAIAPLGCPRLGIFSTRVSFFFF